ncbi:hypothetical protein BOW49_04260 [Solemya velum gill symbiont]|uniref:hydrogenase maturation protease n=1 Tax=Solemya velum gill symbiont TaxID=2340 RepID=UPI00099726FC|nr:hydrogenase maturation protease [Solemya velum gill symbiont]OOZ74327.1 hypothetical protein BOW49_04260 [Solemya velum gill symbiont]
MLQEENRITPILLLGYGNLARGDDALGPMLLENIRPWIRQQELPVDLLHEHQLQAELIMDLRERDLVIFIDASAGINSAIDFIRVEPEENSSFTTHAVTPGALLKTFIDMYAEPPPLTYFMSIRGYDFSIREALTQQATDNLALAVEFLKKQLIKEITESAGEPA